MSDRCAIVAVGIAFLEVAFVARAIALERTAIIRRVAITAILHSDLVAVLILVPQVWQIVTAGGWAGLGDRRRGL